MHDLMVRAAVDSFRRNPSLRHGGKDQLEEG
jgi:hypothetical protein